MAAQPNEKSLAVPPKRATIEWLRFDCSYKHPKRPSKGRSPKYGLPDVDGPVNERFRSYFHFGLAIALCTLFSISANIRYACAEANKIIAPAPTVVIDGVPWQWAAPNFDTVWGSYYINGKVFIRLSQVEEVAGKNITHHVLWEPMTGSQDNFIYSREKSAELERNRISHPLESDLGNGWRLRKIINPQGGNCSNSVNVFFEIRDQNNKILKKISDNY